MEFLIPMEILIEVMPLVFCLMVQLLLQGVLLPLLLLETAHSLLTCQIKIPMTRQLVTTLQPM